MAAALTTVILAAGSASAFSSQIVSIGLTAGDVEDALLGCPEGDVFLGGGFDPEDPSVEGFELLDSSPSSLLIEGWRFEMRDATGLAGARLARGAAICGDVSGHAIANQEVLSGVPPFALPVSPRAECPDGTVAIGGGVRFADIVNPFAPAQPPLPPQTRRLLGLSPVILHPTLGARLLGEIGEGTYDAPYAYQVTGMSYSHFEGLPIDRDEGGGIRATAMCARLADSEIQMVVSEGVAPPMSVASRTARCPGGSAALGGGVATLPEFVFGHEIVSSAPLYFGYPFPQRLWSLDDGAAGAPIGWRGSLRNDRSDELPFEVAAICVVPEPEGWLAALGALAALLALSPSPARAPRRATRTARPRGCSAPGRDAGPSPPSR